MRNKICLTLWLLSDYSFQTNVYVNCFYFAFNFYFDIEVFTSRFCCAHKRIWDQNTTCKNNQLSWENAHDMQKENS